MLPTDYVARACIVNDKNCRLTYKCNECKKEMKSLNEIDIMFYTEHGAELKLTGAAAEGPAEKKKE